MLITRHALLLLLLLPLSSPLVAQNQSQNARLAAAETRAVLAEEKLDAEERRNLILQASNEIEDRAYSRFEIGMGGLAGLITILVIVFGIRTERAAARAARAEIADRKSEIDELLKLARGAATAAESFAERAASHEGQAASLVERAEKSSEIIARAVEIANSLPTLRPDVSDELTQDEISAVKERAREASKERDIDLTIDEFKAKIAKAVLVEENWQEAIRLARGMTFIHGSDADARDYAAFQEGNALYRSGRYVEALHVYEELADRRTNPTTIHKRAALALALYNKGVVLGALGRIEDALKVYDKVFEEFGADEHRNIRVHVARALVNKSGCLSELNRRPEALAVSDFTISWIGESSIPVLMEQTAMALSSKGANLAMLGRYDEGLAICNELISRFAESEHPAVALVCGDAFINKGMALTGLGLRPQARVQFERAIEMSSGKNDEKSRTIYTRATYNMACMIALGGNVKETIRALEIWKSGLETFDCARVTADPDFANVRSKPAFIKFLRMQGCQ